MKRKPVWSAGEDEEDVPPPLKGDSSDEESSDNEEDAKKMKLRGPGVPCERTPRAP